MKTPRRLAGGAAALVALVMLIAACSSSSSPSGSTAAAGGTQKLTTVTYGLSPLNASHLWEVIALAQKTFVKYGINLNLKFFQSESDAVAAVEGGSVDIAEPSSQAAIAAIQKEPSLKIIVGTQIGSVQDIVARKGINSIVDLKGKKIMVNAVGASAGYFTVVGILKAHGLSTSDVHYVNGGGNSARVAAFQSGAVDATELSPPQVETLTAKGAVDLGSGNDVPTIKESLAYAGLSKQSWYGKNKSLVTRFMEGYQDSQKFMNDPANKSKVIADIASALKTTTAGATDVYDYVIVKYGSIQDPTGAVTVPQLQAAARLSSLKPISDSDMAKMFDNSFVAAAAKVTGAKPLPGVSLSQSGS